MAYRWELANANGQTKFSIVPKKNEEKKNNRETKKRKKERTDVSIQIPFFESEKL